MQVSDVMSAIFISQGTIVTGALDGSLLVWDVSGNKGAFGSCIQVGGELGEICILVAGQGGRWKCVSSMTVTPPSSTSLPISAQPLLPAHGPPLLLCRSCLPMAPA